MQKDEDFWFEDGNIVIIAQDIGFRLHKSILSSVSPVFRDLFSVPQPEDAETMDGCQIVRVSDSASDLRHFFRLVIRPIFDFLNSGYRPSFRMLAAICRVGHKYQADAAVEAAAQRIEGFFRGWPHTLQVLGKRQLNIPGLNWEAFWSMHQVIQRTSATIEDAIEAVNLARLLGRPDILPFALFLCCAGDALHLRDGVPGEDGTVERLSSEDYLRCFKAIPQLLSTCPTDVQSLPAHWKEAGSSPECSRPGACLDVFRMMHAEDATEHYVPVVTDLFTSGYAAVSSVRII
ncbi:hypothetical protein BD310DRAFT_961258 [Dichomitus squalens]|uniref:BTB domain-containing protein n=1 Tax=Dichomitus squalens TaxID=114155 RepID=A0A4Q9PKM9_9APHY|nr:hypothetical protein BD310DRAFT_961258 [Dichomitus squalens]